MHKIKNLVICIICGFWVFGLTVWGIILPDNDISISERRKLAQFPKLSASNISNGSFMSDFEKYSADQFPLREGFRSVKSFAEYSLFRQLDSNGIFVDDGVAAQIEYPIDQSSIENAAKKFDFIFETYLDGVSGNIYYSVIPDKGGLMSKKYLSIDASNLKDRLEEASEMLSNRAQYIDITDTLSLDNYYKTDTHWRQERILPTAKKIASAMDVELTAKYAKKKLDVPFYGVYCGQSALPLNAEDIYYLDSNIFDGVIVYDLESQDYKPVYDLEKADGADPYEIFLSGPRALEIIENPNASTDRELIIFRDSFGSSIAPLLIEGYKKITLVDIRYLPSATLANYVDFNGADVLFLYSTLVLNNSVTFK